MIDDLTERAWWAFQLPADGVIACVPAESEEAARGVLRRNCYDKAPVHEWPLIATRWTSRQAVVQRILGADWFAPLPSPSEEK